MSANSSDSESSSCGWTIINNEGSDIETLNSEHEPSGDAVADENSAILEDVEEPNKSLPVPAHCCKDDTSPISEPTPLSLDETKSTPETADEIAPGDTACVGTSSDDSDIVTLEVPKVEEIGAREVVVVDEEAEDSEDLNLGSSSSSQYTFSQPETVFPSRQITDESSNDEVSDSSGPAPRRRFPKRRTVSGSESEARTPAVEIVQVQKPAHPSKLVSSLNGCIILALVIAISMGFGHFYGILQGTIQIREHQKYVEKIHADELNDVMDDLYQCQKEQEHLVGPKLEYEEPVQSLEEREAMELPFEDTRDTLVNEESAQDPLGDELPPLSTQKRTLEETVTDMESVFTENQKLKEQLEGEKLYIHTVLKQKETLLTETQLLRSELDKERLNTQALKDELNEYSYTQSSSNTDSEKMLQGDREMEKMQERLKEMEKKLAFEQQRSDLWERLYIEARDSSETKENPKAKKKSKRSFFGSVKDTFDAMKNSTKEFVRHHKEKIRQAKQAVKEKLKKFSDSVKTTFRHFKDSTKVMFDEQKRKDETNREGTTNGKATFRGFQDPPNTDHAEAAERNAEARQAKFKDSRNSESFGKPKNSRKCSPGHECEGNQRSYPQGCSGVFDCAHRESIRVFNKALDPIKVDEFTYMMQSYLEQEVADFHHWKELEKFINRFFHNGVFIHDRMMFTDFVNDLEGYLVELKEYKMTNVGTFEDLDEFVYGYYFGDTSTQYGPSPAEGRPSFKGPAHEKRAHRSHQRPCHKRDGKWHKDGRTNGRHMANLEIELGPLPFDPKY